MTSSMKSAARGVAPLSLLAFAVAAPMSAGAVTLINKDNQAHEVQIKQGDRQQTVTVPARETLEDVCGDGCEITLGGLPTEPMPANERVQIENGLLGFAPN